MPLDTGGGERRQTLEPPNQVAPQRDLAEHLVAQKTPNPPLRPQPLTMHFALEALSKT
jgi:hypothetical protein